MMTTNSLANMDQTQHLAERLKRMTRVAAAAKTGGRKSVDAEAWQIATALADIEAACNRIFGELVPQLLKSAPESQAASEVLHDIGEEYRHILYHILETKLFGYVVPEPESTDGC